MATPKKELQRQTPATDTDSISLTLPKIPKMPALAMPKSYTPFLIVLLIVAAYFLGALTTKVQYLEKNGAAPAVAGAQVTPGQAAPTAQPEKVDVSVGHFPVLGDDSAKVTLIEFEDFRCPFCEQYFTQTEQQIISDYVNTGKVKLAFRHYQFLGDASVVAGNAAECANEQGKFWDYHNYLYKNQPPETDTSMYNTDSLTQAAGTLGLNTDQFRSCLDSKKYQKNLDTDMADGQKAGVSGTPSFFINGKLLVGAQPYDSFKKELDAALAAAK